MGEMADYYVDLGLNQMLDGDEEYSGGGFICRRGRRTPVHPTCKTCHKRNLRWGKVHNRKTEYQLQEWDGTPHVCDMSSIMPNLDEEESL